jgi:hypothetical protein
LTDFAGNAGVAMPTNNTNKLSFSTASPSQLHELYASKVKRKKAEPVWRHNAAIAPQTLSKGELYSQVPKLYTVATMSDRTWDCNHIKTDRFREKCPLVKRVNTRINSCS